MNKGIFFTALSALLYGSIGYFGASLLAQGLSVENMLLWRFLFSSMLLTPFLLLHSHREHIKNNKKSCFFLFMLGAIFHSLSTLLYFEASILIGTGLAMVIFFTYPIFVAALGYLLKATKLSGANIASLFFIIIGCLLIASAHNSFTRFEPRGLFIALCSGFSYGVYVFYSKELSAALSPIISTFSVCLGTACSFGLFFVLSSKIFMWPQNFKSFELLGLFALIGTVLPVLLLLAGMRYLSASKASIISVLEPIAVLIVGGLVLKEPLHVVQILGALIILSATVLVFERPKSKASEGLTQS